MREKYLNGVFGRCPRMTCDKQVLIPVFANKISKIVLSFYLEGWDLDNINETMDAGFDINLAFKVAPIAPPYAG